LDLFGTFGKTQVPPLGKPVKPRLIWVLWATINFGSQGKNRGGEPNDLTLLKPFLGVWVLGFGQKRGFLTFKGNFLNPRGGFQQGKKGAFLTLFVGPKTFKLFGGYRGVEHFVGIWGLFPLLGAGLFPL